MTKKYLRIGGFSFFPMFFLALSSRMAFAYGGYGGGWGMGPGMMGGWGSGWWGFIPMLLFWGLIIVGVVFLIKLLAQGRTKGGAVTPIVPGPWKPSRSALPGERLRRKNSGK